MLIALVMHRAIFGRGPVRAAILIPYGIVTVVAATVSLAAARSAYTPLRPDVSIDTSAQVVYVKSHPVTVANVILKDYVIHALCARH